MRRLVWMTGFVALRATGIAHGQTTWYVDDDNCPGPGAGTASDPFCRIQTAIVSASDGDEVIVAEDVYSEIINLLGKAVTVRSSDPGSPGVVAATIIDGTGLGASVVACYYGEGPDTVLDGLTITGGNPSAGGDGMTITCSSPTVMHCTFSDNTAGYPFRGGGMCNVGSNPTVTHCTFSGNHAADGGGIHNTSYSRPTVTDCSFGGNSATSGGGMTNSSGSDATVTGCTFSGNEATGGGGMRIHDSRPTVTDCTFDGNSATAGGGMDNSSGGGATVVNCIFSANHATSGAGMISNASEPRVTGCTFSSNHAVTKGGAMLVASNSSATVTDCLLWGITAGSGVGHEIYEFTSTTTVTFSNVAGGFAGESNIDADPLFVSGPHDDYCLSQIAAGQAVDSPCVDAGDPSSALIDGTTRTDEVPDDGTVDMGFHYESHAIAGITAAPPASVVLENASPNPFRWLTHVGYSVPTSSTAQLAVYTVSGRLVRTLVSDQHGGERMAAWDGTNEAGEPVAAGVYFCR